MTFQYSPFQNSNRKDETCFQMFYTIVFHNIQLYCVNITVKITIQSWKNVQVVTNYVKFPRTELLFKRIKIEFVQLEAGTLCIKPSNLKNKYFCLRNILIMLSTLL